MPDPWRRGPCAEGRVAAAAWRHVPSTTPRSRRAQKRFGEDAIGAGMAPTRHRAHATSRGRQGPRGRRSCCHKVVRATLMAQIAADNKPPDDVAASAPAPAPPAPTTTGVRRASGCRHRSVARASDRLRRARAEPAAADVAAQMPTSGAAGRRAERFAGAPTGHRDRWQGAHGRAGPGGGPVGTKRRRSRRAPSGGGQCDRDTDLRSNPLQPRSSSSAAIRRDAGDARAFRHTGRRARRAPALLVDGQLRQRATAAPSSPPARARRGRAATRRVWGHQTTLQQGIQHAEGVHERPR